MQNHRLRTYFRRIVSGSAALVLLLFAPTPYVFADSAGSPASSAGTSCSPVAAAPAGTLQPTGSDATTYTYNSCTGLWENMYYTWNPATQMATPKVPYVYTCDTTTWRWVTKVWVYDPAAGKFEQVPVSKATLPTGAAVAADSVIPCAPPAAPATSNSGSTSNTDSGQSTAGPTQTTPNGAGQNNGTNATMQNAIGSTATTGDASVNANTTGGSATSGDATVVANVLNAVQSASSLNNGNVVTFTANLQGNVNGDLVIDPNALQPASSSSSLNSSNLAVNNQTNGQIHNNITLAANTGDASVTDNTTGGSATTGNASAIANVVNMLNSIVSAGKSFIGVVNINGDMNGNILMPQSFLDGLIASNAPSTTVALTQDQANNLGMTNTANLATTNNVTGNATTGSATVADNTNAGNATTGQANTKVTIFNLTGNQVVGSNCLLVFVNVSGKWVGVILNAPQGSTAAAFGSGLTQNTTANLANVNNTTNNTITNDINVSAHSGNAKVADNTTGGNATSGNANTAVNLLNMNNSAFNLSGWFGILFINIFGNWYGNFGVYTPQTTSVPAAGASSTQQNAQPAARPKMFRFVEQAKASDVSGYDVAPVNPAQFASVSAQLPSSPTGVLGSSVKWVHTPTPDEKAATSSHNSQVIAGGVLVLIGLSLLTGERLVSRRSVQKAKTH